MGARSLRDRRYRDQSIRRARRTATPPHLAKGARDGGPAGTKAGSGGGSLVRPIDISLFIAIHGSFGRPEVTLRPSFYLDKTQDVPIPADEIEFAAMIRGRKFRAMIV